MVNIFDRFTFIMVIFYVSISCYYNVNSIIYHMKEKQREKNSTVAGAVFLPNMRHKVENEENTRFYFSVFNVFNVIICSQREFEAHFMYRFSSHPNFSMPSNEYRRVFPFSKLATYMVFMCMEWLKLYDPGYYCTLGKSEEILHR